jgi:multiple sugar transport system permease protein
VTQITPPVARVLDPGHQPTPPSSVPRERRTIRGTRRAFWLFVGPFFAGLLIFSLIALVWGFYLSFTRAVATISPTEFVWFDNYVSLLTDPSFISSLVSFTVFAVLVVPTTLVVSLVLAMLVANLPVARAFFRSVFFLPTAFSYVIASLIWKLGIFSGSSSSVANSVLNAFGLPDITAWLTESPYYWVVIVTVRLWLQVGFYMLLFIAGLQRIPDTLYEAAALDGLSRGPRRFFSITWPQLRPTTAAVMLLLLVAAFQAFDEFYNLVRTIPSARPPLLYIYNLSFQQLDYGKGAAGAFVVTAIVVIVALIQSRFFGFGAADETKAPRRGARKERAS